MSAYKVYTSHELMMVQVCHNHLVTFFFFWHDPVKLKRNNMVKSKHLLLENLTSHQEHAQNFIAMKF